MTLHWIEQSMQGSGSHSSKLRGNFRKEPSTAAVHENSRAAEGSVELSTSEITLIGVTRELTPTIFSLAEFESQISPSGQEFRRKHRLQRYVRVQIASHEVLRKQVSLPATASATLGKVLKYEVERLSPVGRAAIYFDYRVLSCDTTSGQLRVELRMIHRAVLDRGFSLLRSAGFEPTTVLVKGDRFRFKPAGLVLHKSAVLVAHWRRWHAFLLSIVVASLAVANAVSFVQREDRIAEQAVARLRAVQSQAAVVLGLRTEFRRQESLLSFLNRKKRQPLLEEVLAQLTMTIPADAWIYELELKGSQGRIRGFSSDASKLLPLFERSVLFKEAEFRAPLTQGPMPGTERFDLSFRLKEVAR